MISSRHVYTGTLYGVAAPNTNLVQKKTKKTTTTWYGSSRASRPASAAYVPFVISIEYCYEFIMQQYSCDKSQQNEYTHTYIHSIGVEVGEVEEVPAQFSKSYVSHCGHVSLICVQ